MNKDNRKVALVIVRTAEAQNKDQVDDGIRNLRNLKRHLEGKGAHRGQSSSHRGLSFG